MSRQEAALCALLVVGLLLTAAPLPAQQEGDDLDDVLGGFEDDDLPPPDQPAAAEAEASDAERWWDLTGDFSLGASYNYRPHKSGDASFEGVAPDHRSYWGNLSRLRSQLDLQLDLDLPWEWKARIAGYGFYDFNYIIHGRGKYKSDTKDDLEWEVEFKEVWVQGSPDPSLDLKLGRQIVNWGRSDNLRVVDVLNPLDNREPGVVDIEDLRLPVTMARADYYPPWLPNWSLQAIVVPEFRQNRNPPFGSDFNTLRGEPPSTTPRRFFDEPEYAGSINGVYSGWDISLYVARIYENRPFVLAGSVGVAIAKHSRVTMVGAGGNYTFGSWLFKGETAFFDEIDYVQLNSIIDDPVKVDKPRLDMMAGVEYYGFEETTIAYEIVNRHIFGFDSRMKRFPIERGKEIRLAREDQIEMALRYTIDLWNARLHLTAFGFGFGYRLHQGSVVRLQAAYDLLDALVLTGGIVLYQSGDSPAFKQIGRNDRLFLRLEYDF